MRLGLIAGNGTFPFLVLRAARGLGHRVVVVAIRDEAFPDLEALAREVGETTFVWIHLGQLGRCIETFKAHGVTTAVMAGQVKHVKLFSGVMPDLTLLSVLTKLRSKNTDALIAAVAGVLKDHGITLMNSTALLADLMARPGVLSKAQPTDAMRADFEYGYSVADAVAGLDVGQSIVVKDRAVVAVEAMEGTDETIARAGHLAGDGVAIIKVAKPNQDMRFDVPIVGLATIQAMRIAGARVLSIDAGRTLIFDRDAFFASANEAGIAVVGRAAAGTAGARP